MENITDWYDPKQKPRRIGIFQRNYFGRFWYSYWNGSFWGQLSAFSNTAVAARLTESQYQELPWRGYTRNPE